MKKKINIYIPIEHKVRELNSKILFACEASLKNYRCYIGIKSDIDRILKLKKKTSGVYFFKGGESLDYVKRIKKKCKFFVILDEEAGPADPCDHIALRERILPEVEYLIDSYYSLGPKNFQIAKKVYKNIKKIYLTGWPKIDFIRKDFSIKNEVKNIKDKHGDFILYVSDFGQNSLDRLNSANKNYLELIGESNFKKEDKIKFIKQFKFSTLKTYKEYNLHKKMLKIIDQDSEFSKIIIRPHPYDDFDAWSELQKDFKRIKIIYEGDISDWIEASKGVLHRGCSTALNSFLRNKPTAYVVVKKMYLRNNLSKMISKKLYNINQIKKFTQNAMNAKYDSNQIEYNHIKKIIYLGKNNTSTQNILNKIGKLSSLKDAECKIPIKDNVSSYLYKIYSYYYAIFYLILIKIFKLFSIKNTFIFNINNNILPFIMKLYPGISHKEILSTIKFLGFDKKIASLKILSNCYKIEKK